jgi:hypothetical protein
MTRREVPGDMPSRSRARAGLAADRAARSWASAVSAHFIGLPCPV